MDLQQITLAAVLAVLVLQLITILLITGKKKQGRGPIEVRRPHVETRGEKKDGDPRRGSGGNRKPVDTRSGGGRPQQQSRPQQSQPAAATIDPMEKSLRDINLRLKNAEREQENARKKFQESGGGSAAGGREGRDNRPPHQRSDRGERNDRGGSRNDRGGSGGRDFNRDRPRDNRPERPYRAEQENPGFSGAAAEQPPAAPPAPDIVVNDTGVSEDQLQHGRKFTAKRRQLPPDTTPPEADAPVTEQQFTENATPDVQDVQQDVQQTEQQSEGTDIQFGRR